MIHLEVTVENTAELLDTEAYGAGALLRWESSATQAGTYAEGDTVALVAGVPLYDIWDTFGVPGAWYRTRISDGGGTTFSPYSAPFQTGESSLVSVADARALVASQLADDALQAVIDREEAWLARRIGQLTGERTQTLWIRSGEGSGPRYLQRSTDSVSVFDGGAILDDDDVRLLANGWAIERVSGAWAGPDIEVTYSPNDEAEVVSAVIDLVALGMSVGAMESETLGAYGYKRPANPAARRTAIARRFGPHLRSGTINLRREGSSGRITTIGAVSSGAGS